MQLPKQLIQALCEVMSDSTPSIKLRTAYADLSESYRTKRDKINFSIDTHEKRIAYIIARMPATFHAVSHVLEKIPAQNNAQALSVLDIGTGPGTALWALAEKFPNIKQMIAIEQNAHMQALAKKLSQNHPILKNTEWITGNILTSQAQIPHADLVIASYMLNEVPTHAQIPLLELLWQLATHTLILIDPGTPTGFQGIQTAREWLIAQKAHIVAPCTHTNSCPAFLKTKSNPNSEEWCHFSVRLERSVFHKQLKNAEKGFEDEKFSYLIATKSKSTDNNTSSFRIVRHPKIYPGHLSLELCGAQGFEQKKYSKKDGVLYKNARKSNWGDLWLPS